MLEILIGKIDKYFTKYKSQPHLAALYTARILTAYYGLFRIDELTQSEHIIKYSDVSATIDRSKCIFLLRSSKTHSKNTKPQMVKFIATGQSFCPLQLSSLTWT